ncbi:MAG TPA: dethiobiotin synthase [Polyangia bacterium]|nr:dethiobiotin synthase [Polyangia bacterium]
MSGDARPRGLFVTGTDTGVGKTTVAVGLARLALRRGLVPIPYKPVETGCDPEASDARRLWDSARPPTTLADTCPFPLPMPAAPAAAAASAGIRLEPAELVRRALSLARRGDYLLVEGAGGLLVPYSGSTTNADLASDLGLPVLLVGRVALGTINHVALTLAELSRRRLPVAAVVLARTTEAAAPHEESNASQIEALTGTRPAGILPFLPAAERNDPDRVADALAGALPANVLRRLLAERS